MNSRHAQLSARRVVRAQAGPAPPVGGAQERHHDGRAAVGTCAVVCAREMVGNSYRYWDKLRVGCTPRQNESSQNPLLGRLGPGAGWPESGKLAYSSIGIPCLSDLLTNSHTNTLIPVNHRIRGGWSDTWLSRSVRFRAAKCRVSGFAPRNAKCPISHMRNAKRRIRSLRDYHRLGWILDFLWTTRECRSASTYCQTPPRGKNTQPMVFAWLDAGRLHEFEVHVALCGDQFSRWRVEASARDSFLSLSAVQPFDEQEFKGDDRPLRNDIDEPFQLQKPLVYVFRFHPSPLVRVA
eukprot:COSAG02_NODE_43_length_45989_cov_93.430181_23_plen_294_part_00